jgi:DNA-directed RNA polymerase specialized sigma24 family protein
MGIPEGTVMSRLFYARKKLQALLQETDDPRKN